MNSDSIERKLDKLLVITAKNEEHLEAINGTLWRHEKEINFNSQKIWMAMGGLCVLAFIISTKIVGII